jgi:hypothetical protein
VTKGFQDPLANLAIPIGRNQAQKDFGVKKRTGLQQSWILIKVSGIS